MSSANHAMEKQKEHTATCSHGENTKQREIYLCKSSFYVFKEREMIKGLNEVGTKRFADNKMDPTC